MTMLRMTMLGLLALTVWTATGAAAAAAEPEREALLADPPPEAIDAEALDRAVRASLAVAVRDALAKMDASESKWLFEPTLQKTIVDRKEVKIRYTRKVVMRPVYETMKVKEPVIVPERDGEGYIIGQKVEMKTRTHRRKIGEKPEERLVRDSDGEIVRTERRPIWGPGGPDIYNGECVGNNALALYALLASGVDPEEWTIRELADALDMHIKQFGPPDRTRELAWIAMALTRHPDGSYDPALNTVLEKLLDGQVAKGEAAGLWGPVCVNRERFARIMDYQQVLAKQIESLEARSTNPRAAAQLALLQKERTNLVTQVAAYAGREALWAFNKPDADKLTLQAIDGSEDKIEVPNLPYNIFAEDRADMRSTHLALMALAAADRAGKLPEATPELAIIGGRVLIRPTPAKAVMAKAADALARVQDRDGRWTQLNSRANINEFDRLPIPGVPGPRRLDPLPAPQSLMSQAHGVASINAIERLLAGDNVLRRYERQYSLGLEALWPWVKTYLNEPDPPADQRAKWLILPYDVEDVPDPNDRPPMRGFNEPYDFALVLGDELSARPEAWRRLAYRIVRGQQDLGAWGSENAVRFMASTSTLLPMQQMIDQQAPPDSEDKEVVKERRKLYRQHYRTRFYRADDRMLSTMQAVAFLADTMRPSIAATWMTGEQANGSTLAEPAVVELGEQNGVQLRVPEFAPDLAGLSQTEVVTLVMPYNSQQTQVDDALAAARTELQTFLQRDGLLVVEYPPHAQGRRFAEQTQKALANTLGSLTSGELPDDSKLLYGARFTHGTPTFPTLSRGNDKLAAVFIETPLTQTPADKAQIAASQRMVRNAIDERADPSILNPDYPTLIDDAGDPNEALRMALADLEMAVLGNDPAAEDEVAGAAAAAADASDENARPEEPAEPEDPERSMIDAIDQMMQQAGDDE